MSDRVYSGKTAGELTAGRLKKVKGALIKSDWGQRVPPLTDFTVADVARCSKLLHEQHQSLIPCSRVVEQVCCPISLSPLSPSHVHICTQRQAVEQVPVTVVSYGPKRRQSSFFVYGKEMRVFVPKVTPISRVYQWIGFHSCA